MTASRVASSIGLAIDREDLGGVVDQNLLALNAVGHQGAAQQTQFSPLGEFEGVGLAVVDDRFCLALGVFVETFAFLAEEDAFARLGPQFGDLVALLVLFDFHASRFHDQGSFGHENFAGKDGELLLVVVLERIGLDVHGFVSVRFFGESTLSRNGGEGVEQSDEGVFHKGANLA